MFCGKTSLVLGILLFLSNVTSISPRSREVKVRLICLRIVMVMSKVGLDLQVSFWSSRSGKCRDDVLSE